MATSFHTAIRSTLYDIVWFWILFDHRPESLSTSKSRRSPQLNSRLSHPALSLGIFAKPTNLLKQRTLDGPPTHIHQISNHGTAKTPSNRSLRSLIHDRLQQQLVERSKRRSGPRERVRNHQIHHSAHDPTRQRHTIAPHQKSHGNGYNKALTLSNSQGQGPARRRSRQADQRASPEGCPVIPSDFRRRPRRSPEDQRIRRPQGSPGPRGGWYHQEGRRSQHLQHLQYVMAMIDFGMDTLRLTSSPARAVTSSE